jgi:uncharacterized protein YndB with AHSA1/START domain
MLKIIGVIAVILIVGIVAVLAYAATKPDTFRVQRTASIKAPPDKIFALINDLHSWNAWSPYEVKDPQMKRTFSGASAGKGAIYEWDGDRNVGKGRMEITDASAPSKIVIKLDFISPFEGHNTAEFTMNPKADTTDVTWGMYGPAPFMAKIMHVFINMDRMIGDDFAVGLANLKAVVEKP